MEKENNRNDDSAATRNPGEPEIAVEQAPTEENTQAPNKLGLRIGLSVMALIVAFVAWYSISDQFAPYTDRGTVGGYIARIAPRVSGQVVAVFVEDNTIVEEGDPLFELDARPFELAVRQAEVDFEQATQTINASSAAIVAAQAKVTQARASLENARTSDARTQSLAVRGIVPKAQAEASRAELNVAVAQVEAAEADLASAEAELGSSGRDNPQITAAQLKLEQAQLDLLYTKVLAPTRGVVTNLELAIGQYINTGSAAMTFIDGRGGWIVADMRENQLSKIAPGNKTGLLFDAVPGRIFTGTVHSVAWGIDTGRTTSGGLVQNQPETRWFEPARRIPVRIELDGGMDHWPRNVKLGGKVTVVVYTAGERNPSAWIGMGLHRLQSLLSYLY